MTIKECPQCGCDNIFINLEIHRNISIISDYENFGVIPPKIRAHCGNWECQQKFWYNPKLNKLTRRNV